MSRQKKMESTEKEYRTIWWTSWAHLYLVLIASSFFLAHGRKLQSFTLKKIDDKFSEDGAVKSNNVFIYFIYLK